MQKIRSQFQQLFNGNERIQSALFAFGWGFFALIALLFAVSAFQYRKTADREDIYAQLPLPAAGDVLTTANIGPRDAGGVPQSRFDVFNSGPIASGHLPDRMDAELETLRMEIIALRRSASAMRRLNEELSSRVNQLEDRSASLPQAPGTGIRRAPSRKQQTTRPAAPADTIAATSTSMNDANSAPRSNFGIDLGRFASLDDVRSAWQALKITEASIIGSLSPLASFRQQSSGLSAHLLAGPFPNAADAAATCARLSARKIQCKPTLFVGQQLTMR